MREGMKVNKIRVRSIIIFLILLLIMPIHVRADGWVDKNTRGDTFYSAADASDEEGIDDDKKTKQNAVAKYFSQFFLNVADDIKNALSEKAINLSIDGIVLGRLATNTDVSYAQFELAEGNPWGVIGSIVYVGLGGAVIPIYMLVLQVRLIKQLVKSGQRERAELKEFLVNFVFNFLLLFCLYKIIDFALYGRDALMYSMLKFVSDKAGVSGVGDTISLTDSFRTAAAEKGGAVNILLYFASVCAGPAFLYNYVTTALLQTGLFAAIPGITLRATHNRKVLEEGTATFLNNMFIPFVDMLLLMVPSIFYLVVDTYAGEDAANSFAVRVIQLIIIWSIMPVRQVILQLIWGKVGVVPSSGLRGLAGMAMMAFGALGRMRGNKGGSIRGGHENVKDDSYRGTKEKQEQAQFQADQFASSSVMARDGLQDVNEMLGDKEFAHGEHSDIGGGMAEKADDIDDFLQSSDSRDANDLANEGADNASYEMGDVGIDASMQDGNEIGDYANESTGFYDSVQSQDDMPELGNDMDSIEADSMDNLGSMDNADAFANGTTDNFGDIERADLSGMEENAQNAFDAGASVDGANDIAGNYKNIPNMDDDFAHSLEGSDLDRYANLNAMDAMNQELDMNRNKLSDINASMASSSVDMEKYQDSNRAISESVNAASKDYDNFKDTIGNLEEQNQSIDQRIADISSSLLDGDAGNGFEATAPAAQAELNNLRDQKQQNLMQIDSARAGMAEAQQRIAEGNEAIAHNNDQIQAITSEQQSQRIAASQIQARNTRLESGVNNCRNRERQYATIYADAGMSERTYSNAQAFRVDKAAQMSASSLANYKNFDKGNFDKYLTPEQRTKLYRERAAKMPLNAAKSTAKNVAVTSAKVAVGGAVAAVAGSAMLFNGPSVAAGAAFVGAQVGSGAVSKSLATGGNAIQYVASGDAKYAINDAKNKVAETAHNISRRVNNFERNRGSVSEGYTEYSTKGADTSRKDLLNQFSQDVAENANNFANARNVDSPGTSENDILQQFRQDVKENADNFERKNMQ